MFLWPLACRARAPMLTTAQYDPQAVIKHFLVLFYHNWVHSFPADRLACRSLGLSNMLLQPKRQKLQGLGRHGVLMPARWRRSGSNVGCGGKRGGFNVGRGGVSGDQTNISNVAPEPPEKSPDCCLLDVLKSCLGARALFGTAL